MTDEWYVARRSQAGNKRYGPVPLNQLREMMAGGRVRGEDLIWREGMSEWQQADQCSELNVSVPAQAAPQGYPAPVPVSGAYGYDPGPRVPAPYADDRPYRRPYPRQSSSAWVVPVVIVGASLLFGVLVIGGVAFFASMGSSSSRSSNYSTPSSYSPGSYSGQARDAKEPAARDVDQEKDPQEKQDFNPGDNPPQDKGFQP